MGILDDLLGGGQRIPRLSARGLTGPDAKLDPVQRLDGASVPA